MNYFELLKLHSRGLILLVWILLLAATGFTQTGTIVDYIRYSTPDSNLLSSLPSFGQFGSGVGRIGDLDNNGIEEIAVGSSIYSKMWILFMNDTGAIINEQIIENGIGGIQQSIKDIGFGYDMDGLGDFNGDGIEDIVVGCPLYDHAGTNDGAVMILFLNEDGTVKDEQIITDSLGNLNYSLNGFDAFGRSVANMGDLNGDSITDIAVGIPGVNGTDGEGAIAILFLDTNGTVKSEFIIESSTTNFDEVLSPNSKMGTSVDNIGDLDGNGVNDIVTGAPGENDNDGAVFILFLNSDGSLKSMQSINRDDNVFIGPQNGYEEFGSSVVNIGDINNDSINDIVVGAPQSDDNGKELTGGFYVFNLDTNGTVKDEIKVTDSSTAISGIISEFDRFAYTMCSYPDFDSDGNINLIVGAPYADAGGSDLGMIYIVNLETVSATAEATVWPGDANNDGIVSIEDIFPFGHAWDSSGPARDSITSTWKETVSASWNLLVNDTINAMHIDCDGSGSIGESDINVILQNFNLSHIRSKKTKRDHIRGGIPIFLEKTDKEVDGAAISVPIHLGEQDNQASNSYGMIFSIEFNKNAITKGSMSIDLDSSWLAKDTNVVSLSYEDHDNGIIYIGMTRTDKQEVSGYGEIASLNLELASDSVELVLTPSQPTVVTGDNDTIAVTPIESDTVTVIVDTTLNADTSVVTHNDWIKLSDEIKIYPNPAKDLLYIQNTDYSHILSIEIFNVIGDRLITSIYNEPPKRIITLPIAGLSQGNYVLKIKTNNHEVFEKLVVYH